MKNKRKILVTGGAGYIGSILTEKLLKEGYRVVILDNFTYTDMGIRSLIGDPKITIINRDIRERKAIQNALKGIESVIHLAAIANDPSGELDPSLTRSINYEVYPIILEEAKRMGVKRFINASTFSVYGIKSTHNITEDVVLEPLKEYSICKAKSEEPIKNYNSSSFITTSLRCATTCGFSPRMRFDLIVNTLTFHAILYKKIVVWGGEQQRPQINIHDITDYFIKLLNTPPNLIAGEVFNAGGQNVSIMEIAEIIRYVIDNEIEIETAPAREDERSYHVSSEKIYRILDFKPKKTISDAVSDIVSAYKQGLWKDPLDPIYHNVKRMKELKIV